MTNFLNLPDQLYQTLNSLGLLFPELLLSTSFLGLILIDLLLYQDLKSKQIIVKNPKQAHHFLMILCMIAVLITIDLTVQQFYNTNDTFLFGRMLILDSKAITFKFLILLTTIFVIGHIYITQKSFVGEFYALLISMVLGLVLMTMSVNLLMIYLSIEIVSISSYILTAIEKNKKGLESALKYILFGATASAVMLYGMSLLYGMTGTLDITSPDFSRGISQLDNVAASVAIVLTISGFLFKLSAMPFHIWTPDVYESAPTPVVAFFSVAPKIAGFLVAIRFYSKPNSGFSFGKYYFRQFFGFVAKQRQTYAGIFNHCTYGVCVDWFSLNVAIRDERHCVLFSNYVVYQFGRIFIGGLRRATNNQ
jgi:NADH-quinone oxidoreductase subunit N